MINDSFILFLYFSFKILVFFLCLNDVVLIALITTTKRFALNFSQEPEIEELPENMEITEEVGKDAEGENPEETMESDDKQNEPESMFSLVLLLFIKIIR